MSVLGAVVGALGVIVGFFVGVIVDERLFANTPEWTSAVTPLLFAFAGWIMSRNLLGLLAGRRRSRAS